MKLTVSRPTHVRITREVVHFVKEWRKHQKLSVEALGEMAGISGSMISQLERGKTTYTQNTLEALARAMKLQPWQLLACGPDENAELWRTVMDHTGLFIGIEEEDRPKVEEMFNEMVTNNCEAAVKSARGLYKRRAPDDDKGAAPGF